MQAVVQSLCQLTKGSDEEKKAKAEDALDLILDDDWLAEAAELGPKEAKSVQAALNVGYPHMPLAIQKKVKAAYLDIGYSLTEKKLGSGGKSAAPPAKAPAKTIVKPKAVPKAGQKTIPKAAPKATGRRIMKAKEEDERPQKRQKLNFWSGSKARISNPAATGDNQIVVDWVNPKAKEEEEKRIGGAKPRSPSPNRGPAGRGRGTTKPAWMTVGIGESATANIDLAPKIPEEEKEEEEEPDLLADLFAERKVQSFGGIKAGNKGKSKGRDKGSRGKDRDRDDRDSKGRDKGKSKGSSWRGAWDEPIKPASSRSSGNMASTDPKNAKPPGPAIGLCGYCWSDSPLEFGREESFCTYECYKKAQLGINAVTWTNQDVSKWLKENGYKEYAFSFGGMDGHAFMTELDEGNLRKRGLGKEDAQDLIADIEDMRMGAWFRPEPPLEQLPLQLVVSRTKTSTPKWTPLVENVALRSYAAACKKAVDAKLAWKWFETLFEKLPWADIRDKKYQSEGQTAPRRTAFAVSPGCKCVYKYSGVEVPPIDEPDYLAEIRRGVCNRAGIMDEDEMPNSVNINLYRNGNDHVGWHSDNEPGFEALYRDACILSLSLGHTRKFLMQVMPQSGWDTEDGKITSIPLGHGDICSMEGRFQRHYLHSVPKEYSVEEPRINLTWRWITKHSPECPLCDRNRKGKGGSKGKGDKGKRKN